MNTLLSNAKIALRPVDAVRDRYDAGTLTIGSTLVTLVIVLFACNALLMQAQSFYGDTLLAVGVPESPYRDHPLMSDFARYMSLAMTALLPLVFVALLPGAVLRPAGREATISAVMVTVTASSFYSLVAFGLAFYVSGLLVLVHRPGGVVEHLQDPIKVAAVVLVLFVVIWLMIARRVLKAPWFSAMVVVVVYCGISAVLYWLSFLYIELVFKI